MKASWFLVETAEGAFDFFGVVMESPNPGHALLCSPGGRPLFEIKTGCVTPTTKEALIARIREDAIHAKRHLN
jgi:hypothetical protein